MKLHICKLCSLLVIEILYTDADVVLPTGFTAVSLDIVELDFYRRNISLTLSIANTSLLDGGEIICREWRNFKVVIAGCPTASRL